MSSLNPYTLPNAGKKEWNDRYFNMAKAIQNWQLCCLSLMIVLVILIGVITKLATESRIEPYVVETNNGMPYAMQALQPLEEMKGVKNLKNMNDIKNVKEIKIINFAANEFIMNARTVLADSAAQKTLLDKVYAFSADRAIGYLHDYYQANNPLLNASNHTVEVTIINSMPLSKNTWQVVWDETRRSLDDSTITKTRWIANLSYQFGQVNPHFITDNPFGLYFTFISWSPFSTNFH